LQRERKTGKFKQRRKGKRLLTNLRSFDAKEETTIR
jgi:hypothetical protein